MNNESGKIAIINDLKRWSNEGSYFIKDVANDFDIDLPDIFMIIRDKLYEMEEYLKKYDIDFFEPSNKDNLFYQLMNKHFIFLAADVFNILSGKKHPKIAKIKLALSPDKIFDEYISRYCDICDYIKNYHFEDNIFDSLSYHMSTLSKTHHYGLYAVNPNFKFADNRLYEEEFSKVGLQSEERQVYDRYRESLQKQDIILDAYKNYSDLFETLDDEKKHKRK